MKTLTIFTPTYNRAYILEQAYQSLKIQNNKDFVWMIIDDGSTDNTYDLVQRWKEENVVEIEYYRKENGGKHRAYNFMLNKLKTELVMISLDSDDYLTQNAIEVIIGAWNKNKINKVYGIVSLCDSKELDNHYCKKYDSQKLKCCSLCEAYSNKYFDGGAIFTISSEYIKRFKYPEIAGEKFFTEAYTYYQMDEKFLWLNEITCIREFRNDGLTKNSFKLFCQNPKSWYMYNKLRLEKCEKNIVKYAIYYVAFGKMSMQKGIIKKSPKKIITIVCYPIGILGKVYLMKRSKNV